MVTFRNDKRLLEKYPAKTVKGMRMVKGSELGIENESSVYGGNAAFIAVIAESGVALAITDGMQTLGVGYYNEEKLDEEDREIFGIDFRKTIINEEDVSEEIDEEEQIVLTPSKETVKIVNNKINISKKNNKRK